MKMKSSTLIFIIFILLFSLASCEKKVNSNIYYSTQFLDKFALEEVEENDVDKIPLKEKVYYKIADDKENVSFYDGDSQEEKTINGKILNDKIVTYNDSYLSIIYNEKFYIYNFTSNNYIDLEFDHNDYDNMHIYVTNQKLYLIGGKNNKTDIFSFDENSREKIYSVDINTTDGVIFLYFWDEYYVIQNDKYEYKTNCETNLTKLEINNHLDVLNNEIFGALNYCVSDSVSTSYFFKHNLFFSEESYEKSFYEKNSYIEDSYDELNYENAEYKKYAKMRIYYSNFFDKNTHINYAGRIEKCYQFYYNHIYYFLLTDWLCPYKQTSIRGYYFIRFDAINSKFEISEFNMDDKVKNVKQVGNQIQMTVALNYDGELINRVYYIK